MTLMPNLDGLTNLFKEIKDKEKIADLSLEYQKFAEWLRIEYILYPGLGLRYALTLQQSRSHHIPYFPRRRQLA